MRQHPHAWDMINRYRAWFADLRVFTRVPKWDVYRGWYKQERELFNRLVVKDAIAAFTKTDWCLLRQPFRHRWTCWDHVLVHMPKDAWGAILDYGCGTGEMLNWLRKRRPMYLYDGVDLEGSPQLAYARSRGFSYPRLTHRYDIVTCYETLEHFPKPVQAVEEMLHYLRPGGVLLWDFIDDHEGGNVATKEARREVLRILGGTTGQRECYQG